MSEDLTFQTTKEEGPDQGGGQNAGLVNLTKSYVDKLTRMTPDEREKLKTSIQKFTDPKVELKPEEKKELLTSQTNPNKEEDFNNRLQKARCWMNTLKTKGKNVDKWTKEPQILQSLYYTNKVKASKKLDKFLQELNGVESKG
ncbi:MAG: hypothetical protein HY815_27470 [Candidatus Riflebacteria bacterium]|nr:hypothetical protein [Candidatus Riflebacteria bacterium]